MDLNIESGNKIINKIIENINSVIVGKKEVIELLCMALICEGHVLIEDVPGTGKTTLALAMSKSIGGKFKRISCTPDVMPSDITGFSMYNPKNKEFEYKEGAIMANLFLADEINRTPPKTQSGLLEAMEEGYVSLDGNRYNLPSPFLVIATQNPIEHLGTYPLPEAQLDRFLLKIKIGYPTKDDEKNIIKRFGQINPLDSLQAVTTPEEIDQLKTIVSNIILSENIMDYIVELITATRTDKDLILGLSPRATLWIAKISKAWAFYNGRDFVIPDDVKYIFKYVCAHRVTLKSEIKFENITSEDILEKILNRVAIPG